MVASRESNYKVTLIDATGHFHSAQNTPDANNCIVGPKIDSAFNTAAEVRILVTSGNESNRLVGDAQLFLHDPNAPASINHLLAKQVGKTILRMKWRNLNDATKYEIIHEFAQNMTIVECDSGEDCTGHIHVPAASIEAVTVTLIENGDIQQITTTSVNIQNSIADIEISRINPLWDDRVLVCFETPLGVDSYELGLEVSNEILEITVNPEFAESEEGTSCFVSRNTVEVGAYVELWSLISAYDVAGNLMASGEKTLQSVFLSVNRAVYGAVINDSLLTSWHLIDSTKGISHITVVLKALTNQGVEVMDTVDLNPEETSYRFGATEGKYTICVKAVAVSVSSKEICSDIIHVRTGQEVMVPPVASASPKTTSKNGVLVVWESSQDEDVTGFLISWTQILSSSTSTPIPSSQRENEGYLYPLDLVRTVSRDRNAGETGFKIVSASETYVEIVGLATGGRYTLCVASVKEDVVGSQNCDISDLSQYQPLEAPANLHYEGGLISWQGYESSNYLVQWQSRADKSEGGSDQVVGISYRMSFMPGQWDVKVRTMTDISSSDAAGTTLFIEGLVVSARQSQESSITASWYEETIVQTSTTSKIDNRSYEVKILQNEVVVGGPDHVPCVGWLTRCSHEIINLNMSATSSATVIVTENGGGRSASYNLRVEDFTGKY
ncbi:hypothetical protein SK128_020277 [Halocaridina rubra]|uniref:Uncharacterized protein n=1 Tax=Halocaridina rubra TaxID=373956 RepID=A0AAN9AFD6_HALRR